MTIIYYKNFGTGFSDTVVRIPLKVLWSDYRRSSFMISAKTVLLWGHGEKNVDRFPTFSCESAVISGFLKSSYFLKGNIYQRKAEDSVKDLSSSVNMHNEATTLLVTQYFMWHTCFNMMPIASLFQRFRERF